MLSNVSCGDESDGLDESERSAETAARALIWRIIELLESSPQGSTPARGIDPTALPATVDLDRLAGRPIPGEPFEACAFGDRPISHVRAGTATLRVRCGSSATGIVGISDADVDAIPNTAPGVPDNVVACWRGARQSNCHLRHGKLQLSTTVDCPGGCRDDRTPSALMALIAQALPTLP